MHGGGFHFAVDDVDAVRVVDRYGAVFDPQRAIVEVLPPASVENDLVHVVVGIAEPRRGRRVPQVNCREGRAVRAAAGFEDAVVEPAVPQLDAVDEPFCGRGEQHVSEHQIVGVVTAHGGTGQAVAVDRHGLNAGVLDVRGAGRVRCWPGHVDDWGSGRGAAQLRGHPPGADQGDVAGHRDVEGVDPLGEEHGAAAEGGHAVDRALYHRAAVGDPGVVGAVGDGVDGDLFQPGVEVLQRGVEDGAPPGLPDGRHSDHWSSSVGAEAVAAAAVLGDGVVAGVAGADQS